MKSGNDCTCYFVPGTIFVSDDSRGTCEASIIIKVSAETRKFTWFGKFGFVHREVPAGAPGHAISFDTDKPRRHLFWNVLCPLNSPHPTYLTDEERRMWSR